MQGQFKERLRYMMSSHGFTVKDLGQRSGVEYRTIEGWLGARESLPRADVAVKVAYALETTVEELLNGPSGRDYVLSWANNSGILYQAPVRISRFIPEFDAIPDEDLDMLYSMIHACAEKSRRLSQLEASDTG